MLKKDKAPDPDHRVYAPFPVLGYSGKDRVKYFWLYRTGQSDPWIFGPVTGSVFGEPSLFRPLVIGTDIWKSFGYNTVIYLAAILGIDPTLYEAAAVDGAGRFRRIWHITLPGIRMTVALLAILALGNILNAGFDQIYNLYNPLVYSTGDIIDTWVYRYGLQNLQFSLATTVGLFKSVISLILITLGYWLADKFTGYKLF